MGIVTWTRADTPLPCTGRWTVDGRPSPYAPFNFYPATRFETTTSWRTGKGDPGSLNDEDGFTGSSGSRIEFQRELEKSNRELGKPSTDTGHEFKSVKETIEVPFRHHKLSSSKDHPFWGDSVVQYEGMILPFSPWNLQPPFPTVPELSLAEINMDGARAINRTLPTKSVAGLMQFLGELREQLPQITGHAIVRARGGPSGLGQEHLNIQFGWRPFVSDLQRFARSVLIGNNLLRQYMRDSGRQVRRRTTLFEGQSEKSKPGEFGIVYPRIELGLPFEPFTFLGSVTQATISDVTYQRVWFSGAYTYLIADLSSWIKRAERYDQQANHLLGTRLTPSVLWELTPWSWMIDWFGNFGAVVENANALTSDSLVLRYGYIMHHYKVTREVTVKVMDKNFNPLPDITAYFTTDSKVRTRATPYGFGLDLSNLNPRQWAILGALGLTSSPRSLRLDQKPQPRLRPQKGRKRLPRVPRNPGFPS